jgi:hypothetical protein
MPAAMASGEFIIVEFFMNDGIVEAAIGGALLAIGFAIWLLAGYLNQRFAFRNPTPTTGTVVATSLSASMLLFSLGALMSVQFR